MRTEPLAEQSRMRRHGCFGGKVLVLIGARIVTAYVTARLL